MKSKSEYLQMRNPQGITKVGRIEWDPFAFDKNLWISPDEFEAFLQRLSIKSEIHLRSLKMNDREPVLPPTKPGEVGVLSVSVAPQKQKPQLSKIAVDPETDTAHIMMDSTATSEMALDQTGNDRTSREFHTKYGEMINKELLGALRKLAIIEFLERTNNKETPRQERLDNYSLLFAVATTAKYTALLLLFEFASLFKQSDRESIIPTLLLSFFPMFLFFYVSSYKIIASLMDAEEEHPNESRETLTKAYLRNLLRFNNFPSSPNSLRWGVALVHSFIKPEQLIVGSSSKPTR